MDQPRIQKLLAPFLHEPLTADQLDNISTYVDLLLRWNARMNLTAVRDEEHIVTRHFGESLFAAHHLFPADPRPATVADVGSGAGFPGLPIKIAAPDIHLTLIESNNKKATFLREVIRDLELTDAEVFDGRAADFPAASADLVTLRAVERFDDVLPAAARLVAPTGRLALLIGNPQADRARQLLPAFHWHPPAKLPQAQSRILLIGTHQPEPKR
jgi:16S rRNA (guanine527-N7)-methyltransferase